MRGAMSLAPLSLVLLLGLAGGCPGEAGYLHLDAGADRGVSTDGTPGDNGKPMADKGKTPPDKSQPNPDKGQTGSKTATGGSGGAKGTVSATCGARSYMLHVPASYNQNKPAPLVAAMHGYGDTYQNFFAVAKYAGWAAAADAAGFIFMVPNHQNTTRQSFLHLKGTSLDAAGTQTEMKSLLQCIYNQVGAKYNLDTTAIYWVGFSEGATFSVYAAYVLHKELRAIAPYAGAVSGLPLPTPRKIPVYFICGAQDSSYASVAQSYQAWTSAGHPGKSSWVAGVGHKFSSLNLQGVKPGAVYQWMSTVKSDPVISGYKKP